MTSSLRPFILPLVLVGVLAGALGFFVTRAIAGDSTDAAATVSVVELPSTPTPSPPSPTPTEEVEESDSGGRSSGRDPRCPSGCECSFPPGGTVIVCRGGGSVTIP